MIKLLKFFKKNQKSYPSVKLRERKIVSITSIATNHTIATLSDFTLIVLCDDDTIWMTNNRSIDNRDSWKRLISIPKY